MTTAPMIRIKRATEATIIVGIAQPGRESFCSSFFRASAVSISEEVVFDQPGVDVLGFDNVPDVDHSVEDSVPDAGDPVVDHVP